MAIHTRIGIVHMQNYALVTGYYISTFFQMDNMLNAVDRLVVQVWAPHRKLVQSEHFCSHFII